MKEPSDTPFIAPDEIVSVDRSFPDRIRNEAELINELTNVFNRLCVDSDLHTPDFMLAENVVQYLSRQLLLINSRRKWGCL